MLDHTDLRPERERDPELERRDVAPVDPEDRDLVRADPRREQIDPHLERVTEAELGSPGSPELGVARVSRRAAVGGQRVGEVADRGDPPSGAVVVGPDLADDPADALLGAAGDDGPGEVLERLDERLRMARQLLLDTGVGATRDDDDRATDRVGTTLVPVGQADQLLGPRRRSETRGDAEEEQPSCPLEVSGRGRRGDEEVERVESIVDDVSGAGRAKRLGEGVEAVLGVACEHEQFRHHRVRARKVHARVDLGATPHHGLVDRGSQHRDHTGRARVDLGLEITRDRDGIAGVGRERLRVPRPARRRRAERVTQGDVRLGAITRERSAFAACSRSERPRSSSASFDPCVQLSHSASPRSRSSTACDWSGPGLSNCSGWCA